MPSILDQPATGPCVSQGSCQLLANRPIVASEILVQHPAGGRGQGMSRVASAPTPGKRLGSGSALRQPLESLYLDDA